MIKKNIITIIIYLYFINFSFLGAQNKIQGFIYDNNNTAIENVNVILKDAKTSSIINFTKTSNNGYFEINNLKLNNQYVLKFSHLGFKSQEKTFEVTNNNSNLEKVVLSKNAVELTELILDAKKNAISVSGDTTRYNVNYFKNGTENNLKDLLNNLPGISTNSNGKIIVNGKEISELLIDGENLFKKQHQLATENFSAESIKSIELYKNHIPFDQLKTNTPSSLTALNVLLKDNHKNKIKGFIQSEYNFDYRKQINTSIYNLSKKNKFSLIQNNNNLGKNAIGIADYLSLNEEDEQLETKNSGVTFSNSDDIPRFLKIGENAVKLNHDFVNISNIFTPNKKTKVSFYSLVNLSNLKEKTITQQDFTDSDLAFIENIITSENNTYGLITLKGVNKPNENTIINFSNSLIIDNIKNENLIDNISLNNNTYQKKNSDKLLLKSNLRLSKKIKKNFLLVNSFLNYNQTKFDNTILSDTPFLDFDFKDDFMFKQNSDNLNQKIGYNAKYTWNLKKFFVDFKTEYTINKYYLNNTSATNLYYRNNYTSSYQDSFQEIGINYELFKNTHISFYLNNNQIQQIVNYSDRYSNNFIGYTASLKFAFGSNSSLQISNSLTNNISNQDNLIENYQIKDYRNIWTNLNLTPNTLFPINKLSLNYFKFNVINNTALIFNLNHTYTNKALGSNLIYNNNFITTQYTISPKDKLTTLMFFFEKKINQFNLNFNIDFNKIEKEFFINSILSNYSSNYLSNSVNLKSNFKQSPVHFKIGYNYSFANFKNNGLKNKQYTLQNYISLNGMLKKDFYWNIIATNTLFKLDSSERRMLQISPSIRYSKKTSGWEIYTNAHNILNLNNSEILTNSNNAGYNTSTIVSTLAGYINIGAKYKF